MAAELHRSESGTQGVRRIARREIRKACQFLGRERPSDEEIHSARKDLKKARAALRLLRDALGNKVYKRENTALRDVARPLSRIRDSKVLSDTLEKLTERFGKPAKAAPVTALRREFARRRTAIRRGMLTGRTPLKQQGDALRSVHDRARRWRVGKHGWCVLGSGIKRVYANARDAFSVAQSDPTPENLHEWRKQTKYLWHQLQFLAPLRPALIDTLADEAHRLSEYLGDDHDLSVLREAVVESEEVLADAASRNALLGLIDRYRDELRKQAIRLGDRLLEEKPSAFETRFGEYWHDWRRKRGPTPARARQPRRT